MKSKIRENKWKIAFVFCCYLFSIFSQFHYSKQAYIYESKHDRLFSVRLAPNFSNCSNWELLVPFRSCPSTEIISVAAPITLAEAFQRNEKLANLKTKEDYSKFSRSVSSIDEYTFWDIEYISNFEPQVLNSMPHQLLSYFLSKKVKAKDMRLIDIAVFKYFPTRKTKIEAIERAVMFEGDAAQTISNLIY